MTSAFLGVPRTLTPPPPGHQVIFRLTQSPLVKMVNNCFTTNSVSLIIISAQTLFLCLLFGKMRVIFHESLTPHHQVIQPAGDDGGELHSPRPGKDQPSTPSEDSILEIRGFKKVDHELCYVIPQNLLAIKAGPRALAGFRAPRCTVSPAE